MKTKLTIIGTKFLINNQLTYSEYPNCNKKYHGLLMNARFIQGIFDDKTDRTRFNRFGKIFSADNNTDELIQALPQWYAKGLRAITVGLQGGGPCNTIDKFTINNNPFSCDGKKIDTKYLKRMHKIISACDNLGMVVIVNFFYSSNILYLDDENAIKQATKTASNWLRDQNYTNVIIDIVNEQNLDEFKSFPLVCDSKKCATLIPIAQKESNGIPTGCSLAGGGFSEEIAKASDVILIHGNNLSRQGLFLLAEKAKNVYPPRPVICNEDSQAISRLKVALNSQISWGYYNNLTKQEPPAYWEITKGEDSFFANRLAIELGIIKNIIPENEQFYIQGLEKHMVWNKQRWIRLASLYPENIDHVDFFVNNQLKTTSYDDPFLTNMVNTWNQRPFEALKTGDSIKVLVYLRDNRVLEFEKKAH